MIRMIMKKVNEIYVTKCVSFPRSGHHWLHTRLQSYFESRFNYCEKYHSPEKMIDVCPITNYQKTHDFELKEQIHTDIKHIIQIRNFEDACISYYRLEKLKFPTSTITPIQSEKPFVDVQSDDYVQFSCDKKIYYDGFVKKWIENTIPNSLVIRYENMIKDPLKEMSSVINFITDDDLDLDKLKWNLRFDGQTKCTL